MIIRRVREVLSPGMIIPKPEAEGDFVIKGWGMRRGSPALIYLIPNHHHPEKPYQKGITEQEFEVAYAELDATGELTRKWFNENLSECAAEGSCNFTTVGGVFELLDIARYSDRGVYMRSEDPK